MKTQYFHLHYTLLLIATALASRSSPLLISLHYWPICVGTFNTLFITDTDIVLAAIDSVCIMLDELELEITKREIET